MQPINYVLFASVAVVGFVALDVVGAFEHDWSVTLQQQESIR